MLQLAINSSLFGSCFCLCSSTILLWCLTSDRVLQPILLDRLLSTGFFGFFATHRPSSHSFLSSFFVHFHNLWRSVDLAILRVDLWGPIISLFSHFWLPTHWLHWFRSSGCSQQLLLPLNLNYLTHLLFQKIFSRTICFILFLLSDDILEDLLISVDLFMCVCFELFYFVFWLWVSVLCLHLIE